MDILDEIEDTLNKKKRKWDYTPMREKSETDALIDELLREFASDGRNMQEESYYSKPQPVDNYNTRSEYEERAEYNQAVGMSGNQKPQENDATRIFSVNEAYQEPEPEPYYDNSGEAYNNQNDNGYGGDGSGDENYDDYDQYEDEEFDENRPMNNEEFVEFLDSEDDSNRDYIHIKKSPWKIAWRVIYTAVIAAFTIIGIFSSAIYILEQFEMTPADKKAKDDALKAEVQTVIYPIVETQAKDFASFEDISDEDLVNISVWEIIINGNIKVFKDSESEEIIIPDTQISYVVEKLFGSEETPNNVTAGIGEVPIIYDKDKKGYIVPENSDIYTLYPVVTNVSVSDDIYTVSVDCFNDSPAWVNQKKTTPAKKMVFKLKKTSEYYNIISAETVS